MDLSEKAIFAFIGVIILAFVLLIGDTIFTPGEWRQCTAVVVGKSFSPSRTDVGTGTDSNGNFVMTTTYHGEEWTVVVKSGDNVIPVKTNRATWAAVKDGENVTLHSRRSKLFGVASYAVSAMTN